MHFLFRVSLIGLKKAFYILLLPGLFAQPYFTTNEEVVHIESFKRGKEIAVYFHLNQKYGIQKGPLHAIYLYELKKNHIEQKNIKDKIKYAGKLIQMKKTFEGETASKNNKYFSSVLPMQFSLKQKKTKQISSSSNTQKKYALKGKIFYCSFKKGFCSVHTFEKLIP